MLSSCENKRERGHIIMNHTVRRNDPCPCGSGKKYKNCCMNEKSFVDEYNEMRQYMAHLNNSSSKDEQLYYIQRIIDIGNELIERKRNASGIDGYICKPE